MTEFISIKCKKPENGTIVEIRTKRKSCGCAGYQITECYYDNGIFNGIINQGYVVGWRISRANDLIKELDSRKEVIAKECANCFA